jgi:Flp pilus assembly protein TadB
VETVSFALRFLLVAWLALLALFAVAWVAGAENALAVVVVIAVCALWFRRRGSRPAPSGRAGESATGAG